MAVELVIPEAGESITEVRVGAWRKPEGSWVALDEVLVEIETDKAAMELPAPIEGTLAKILRKEGEDASPGDVIALLEAGAPPGEAERRPERAPAGQVRSDSEAPSQGPEPRVMPSARRILAQGGMSPSASEATGPGGRVLKEDALRSVGHLSPANTPPQPASQQRAGDRSQPSEPTQEPPPEQSGPGAVPPVVGPPKDGTRGESVVPMTPLRKVVARNLVRAQQEAALLTTFNEVDMSEVIRLRRTYAAAFQKRHDIKLGFMSFFVRAVVDALQTVPAINARINGEDIVYRNYQDIGIAVGGGRGLVVPVMRNAESMTFAQIEKTIADFADRARRNKLELSELRGGTFTISNGGIYGSMLSTPIINPPQSGILGMHAIQDRAVAVDGQVAVRPMMYIALTYDHRIVDGREAVTFLKRVKELVEEPERIWLQV
ncbi:MAG: 2-oxoglutarate dehydrogenase complex dihydrolipoyllysine-residue succinyltransferase [Bryobacterales bacterium]|nr:2-oxoglutarate dehydrogenase complex dihydrolipoyllysine-residue succinyltransferase [Bryobacterales bacterium]